jgi:hypothetical protein
MYTIERLPTDLELLAIKGGIAYRFFYTDGRRFLVERHDKQDGWLTILTDGWTQTATCFIPTNVTEEQLQNIALSLVKEVREPNAKRLS